MKNAIKLVTLAMMLWLVFLAIVAGICMAFGHGWTDWCKPAITSTVMVLIGAFAVASQSNLLKPRRKTAKLEA